MHQWNFFHAYRFAQYAVFKLLAEKESPQNRPGYVRKYPPSEQIFTMVNRIANKRLLQNLREYYSDSLEEVGNKCKRLLLRLNSPRSPSDLNSDPTTDARDYSYTFGARQVDYQENSLSGKDVLDVFDKHTSQVWWTRCNVYAAYIYLYYEFACYALEVVDFENEKEEPMFEYDPDPPSTLTMDTYDDSRRRLFISLTKEVPGIIIDTAAVVNAVGEHWANMVDVISARHGRHSTRTQTTRQFQLSGIAGAKVSNEMWTAHLCLVTTECILSSPR